MSCDRNGKEAGKTAGANGIPRLASQSAGVLAARRKSDRIGIALPLRMNPAVVVESETKRSGRYLVEPLPGGYGITMGNALRRTLLSGLKGAAVTSVKVQGVDHEFSTIPHAREDMTDLSLNLKQLRLRFKEDKPARLKLKVRGEGTATAGDLELPDHVEVVNPDLPLLTGTSAETRVDIEMSAATGYGYSPSEERSGLPIGETPVDAIFSPVRQANFKVLGPSVPERARAGHNYEKLLVEVTTDGSLTPQEAVREASGRLAKYLDKVSSRSWYQKSRLPALPYRRTIAQIGLAPRTQNALGQAGFETVLDVMKSLRRGDREIKGLKGMGETSWQDLIEQLRAQNLSDGDREVLTILTNPPLGNAVNVLKKARTSKRFKEIEWQINENDNYQLTIRHIETAHKGRGHARMLLQELQGTGIEVSIVRPPRNTLPFWRKMYKEGLIVNDPDAIE